MNKFLANFKHKNFGGRNFILSLAGMVITMLMDGLDPETKAWVISAICGSHSVSRGLADGMSKGSTTSK